MLNVFSDSRLKPSEQILKLQECAGSLYERELFAGPECEPLYMLKPGMIDILEWVNRKILFELPRIKILGDSKWVEVRIRIATSMLNKQVDAGIIEKTTAIIYHERLTSRVRQILGQIWTEDLPF